MDESMTRGKAKKFRSDVLKRHADSLRQWVEQELSTLRLEATIEEASVLDAKERIRQLHAPQKADLLRREKVFIAEWQERLLPWFANGVEIDPAAIDPVVIPVATEEEAALFRYTTLQWSVPVSRGYGRRTRFLVLDQQNGCLIGVFALGDPVYNLTARDSLIGWDAAQRKERLYNVLDAFVLGAIAPYRQLLGGKLVAMSAVSDETRDFIQKKYKGQVTQIQRRSKEPRPVLVTTTSALGRSSIYNRLNWGPHRLYESVGYTKGYGHFQFSEELFRALCRFLEVQDALPGYKFGQGPNWRMRTIRVALNQLGLDPDLVRHGIRREVFLAPLASNWREFLRGETSRPRWTSYPLHQLRDHFVHRWAIPRSQRDPSYKSHRALSMLLGPRDQRRLF